MVPHQIYRDCSELWFPIRYTETVQSYGSPSDIQRLFRAIVPHQIYRDCSELWFPIRYTETVQSYGSPSDIQRLFRAMVPHQIYRDCSELWFPIRYTETVQSYGSPSELCINSYKIKNTYSVTISALAASTAIAKGSCKTRVQYL